MPEINRIAGIILAAGGSRRMAAAGPKQLLSFRGQSLLRHAALTALAVELSPLVVVLGDDPQGRILREVDNLLILTVSNPDWHNGMGTSIRAGMAALKPFAPLRGVALMLCDQPHIPPESLRRLVLNFSRASSGISAAAYDHTVGVPAIFGPEYFPILASLPDPAGAKSLLQSASNLRTLNLPEAAQDIDNPTAYHALITVAPLQKILKKKRPARAPK